jgi:putative FmdB family regulatory protein
VPIYEFDCPACDERFEDIVPVGTEVAKCPSCGADGAERIWVSAPSPVPRLVMTPRQGRQMQVKRGVDRATAKERFVERRQKQRAERRKKPGGES